MDFSLGEETELLTASLRRFVEQELQPLEQEVEANVRLEPDQARDIFRKSRELGFYAMNMPEDLGGGGLGSVDMCLAEQEMGRTSDILVRRAFGNVYEVLPACVGPKSRTMAAPPARKESAKPGRCSSGGCGGAWTAEVRCGVQRESTG